MVHAKVAIVHDKLSITMVHLKVNNCDNVLLIVISPIVNTKVVDENSNYRSFKCNIVKNSYRYQ